MTTNPASLATTPDDPGGGVIAPVASIEATVAAFKAYEDAKAQLLTEDDYQQTWESDGKGGKKQFTKRSGWRKLAIAFGVDFEITAETITYENPEFREGIVNAEYKVLAKAPNGRFVDATGFCSRSERCCAPGCTKADNPKSRHQHCPAEQGDPCHPKRHFSKPDHDIPTTAETRAKNRAAADLFGMGEVTAEEAEAGGGMDETHEPEPDAYFQQLRKAVNTLVTTAAKANLIDRANLNVGEKSAELIATATKALGYTSGANLDADRGNDVWLWSKVELGLADDDEKAALAKLVGIEEADVVEETDETPAEEETEDAS